MCNLYSITTNQAAIIALFRGLSAARAEATKMPLLIQTNVYSSARP
jgi:hypothetical protein